VHRGLPISTRSCRLCPRNPSAADLHRRHCRRASGADRATAPLLLAVEQPLQEHRSEVRVLASCSIFPLLLPRARMASLLIPSRRSPSCRHSGRCRCPEALRWVTRDARYLPVRSPLETKVGSAFAHFPSKAPRPPATRRRMGPPPAPRTAAPAPLGL
jgi:hypothetical protein